MSMVNSSSCKQSSKECWTLRTVAGRTLMYFCRSILIIQTIILNMMYDPTS